MEMRFRPLIFSASLSLRLALYRAYGTGSDPSATLPDSRKRPIFFHPAFLNDGEDDSRLNRFRPCVCFTVSAIAFWPFASLCPITDLFSPSLLLAGSVPPSAWLRWAKFFLAWTDSRCRLQPLPRKAPRRHPQLILRAGRDFLWNFFLSTPRFRFLEEAIKLTTVIRILPGQKGQIVSLPF